MISFARAIKVQTGKFLRPVRTEFVQTVTEMRSHVTYMLLDADTTAMVLGRKYIHAKKTSFHYDEAGIIEY